MPQFLDHFSGVAADYLRYRPRYPLGLFDYIHSIAPASHRAWDCGTGNGQAAVAMAAYFEEVVATDASASQIAHAIPHPRVYYAVAPAEQSGLKGESVEVITVAQALHWFDRPAFYAEANRVLKSGGILAAWSYGWATPVDAAIYDPFRRFYAGTLGNYWPPERRVIGEGYYSLEFPFEDVEVPPFEMKASFSLQQLLGYARTWSATQRFISGEGVDPLPELEEALKSVWGPPEQQHVICWPLGVRIGRK